MSWTTVLFTGYEVFVFHFCCCWRIASNSFQSFCLFVCLFAALVHPVQIGRHSKSETQTKNKQKHALWRSQIIYNWEPTKRDIGHMHEVDMIGNVSGYFYQIFGKKTHVVHHDLLLAKHLVISFLKETIKYTHICQNNLHLAFLQGIGRSLGNMKSFAFMITRLSRRANSQANF